MQTVDFLVVIFLLAFTVPIATAYDPSLLQDFCVANNNINTGVFVNGRFCKDPKLVTAQDFFFSGLHIPRNTANPVGSNATIVSVDRIPGVNTLGVSLVRVDIAPSGTNPPHAHPRASEFFLVLKGTLYVGFVTSNQLNNTLFAKVLKKGDVFVFPMGLIHFQFNIGKTNAVAIAGFNSQNPGVTTVANTIFGSSPRINPYMLATAFQLNLSVVKSLEAKTWIINN